MDNDTSIELLTKTTRLNKLNNRKEYKKHAEE